MKAEIYPYTTTCELQYDIWKNAPNPMLVFVKKTDVTPLAKACRKFSRKS